MAQGCGCGCKGRSKTTALQKTTAPSTGGLGRTASQQRAANRLTRDGLAQRRFTEQFTDNPWLVLGPEGVSVAGRQFTWQTVGGFVIQGALLYMLWVNLREGQEAFTVEQRQ